MKKLNPYSTESKKKSNLPKASKKIKKSSKKHSKESKKMIDEVIQKVQETQLKNRNEYKALIQETNF